MVLFPDTATTVCGHGFVTLRSKKDSPKVLGFRTWLFAELLETQACWESFLAAQGRGPQRTRSR